MPVKKSTVKKDSSVYREKSVDSSNIPMKAYCIFCGSTVGQISERTEGLVNAVYDCPKCRLNYCDQCSYEKIINGHAVQLCLRCDSRLDKVI